MHCMMLEHYSAEHVAWELIMLTDHLCCVAQCKGMAG